MNVADFFIENCKSYGSNCRNMWSTGCEYAIFDDDSTDGQCTVGCPLTWIRNAPQNAKVVKNTSDNSPKAAQEVLELEL
jgi:hypothetical protein